MRGMISFTPASVISFWARLTSTSMWGLSLWIKQSIRVRTKESVIPVLFSFITLRSSGGWFVLIERHM